MEWKIRVFCLAAGFLLLSSMANATSYALICVKDATGEESCIPASEVQVKPGAFYVKTIRTQPIFPETAGPAQDHVNVVFYGTLQSSGFEIVDGYLKRLKEDYGDKISVEIKHYFPKDFILFAEQAAEASECARDQGKFDEFNRKIFATRRQPQELRLLEEHAVEAGLNASEFKACLSSGNKKNVVEKHLAEANASGVDTDVTVIGKHQIYGAFEYEAYKTAVESALRGTPFSLENFTKVRGEDFELPKPKHSRSIDSAVAAAIDFYEPEPSPLHLKFVFSNDKLNWTKRMLLIADAGGIIEKAEEEKKTVYLTLGSDKVDGFSSFSGISIDFDDAYPRPIIPSPTPSPEVSITPEKNETSNIPPIEPQETVIASHSAVIKISDGTEEKRIEVSEENGFLTVESQGVKASVSNDAQLGFGMQGIEIEGKQVILPDQALASITPTPVVFESHVIELKNRLFNPVYEVRATSKAKILGVIPADYTLNAVVDAVDGSIEKIERPWWAFLAN